MRIIGSFEAKTHFSKLLVEVSKGEKILITKNGKSIAMLVPVEVEPEIGVQSALEKLRALRKQLSSQKLTVDDIQAMKDKGKK